MKHQRWTFIGSSYGSQSCKGHGRALCWSRDCQTGAVSLGTRSSHCHDSDPGGKGGNKCLPSVSLVTSRSLPSMAGILKSLGPREEHTLRECRGWLLRVQESNSQRKVRYPRLLYVYRLLNTCKQGSQYAPQHSLHFTPEKTAAQDSDRFPSS